MSGSFTDKQLEARIRQLQSSIRTWARQHHLWSDAGFKSWQDHFNSEPGTTPVVTALVFEGPLYGVLNNYDSPDLFEEFDRLVDSSGHCFEFADHTTALFYVRDDDSLESAFRDYFAWEWALKLVRDDVNDLYEEFFDAIAQRPNLLLQLDWRQFETFLDSLFAITVSDQSSVQAGLTGVSISDSTVMTPLENL